MIFVRFKLYSKNLGEAKDLPKTICIKQATIDTTSKDHIGSVKRLSKQPRGSTA